MKLSAGQAAQLTGKSIPTITRAINKGTISAEKTSAGGYLIEPSELFRVFTPLPLEPDTKSSPLGSETPPNLELELKMLREILARADETISDLRLDRDKWREQADRTTKLLPSPAKLHSVLVWPWKRRLTV